MAACTLIHESNRRGPVSHPAPTMLQILSERCSETQCTYTHCLPHSFFHLPLTHSCSLSVHTHCFSHSSPPLTCILSLLLFLSHTRSLRASLTSVSLSQRPLSHSLSFSESLSLTHRHSLSLSLTRCLSQSPVLSPIRSLFAYPLVHTHSHTPSLSLPFHVFLSLTSCLSHTCCLSHTFCLSHTLPPFTRSL